MRRGCEFSFPIHKEIREVDDEQMLCNVNVGDRLIVPVREVTRSYVKLHESQFTCRMPVMDK